MIQRMVQFTISLSLFITPFLAQAGHGKEECGSGFCWLTLLCGLIWLLVTSALLFASWNHVLAGIFKSKKVKYWHALLVVATICAFCLPKHFSDRCNEHGHHCKYKHHKKHHGGSTSEERK